MPGNLRWTEPNPISIPDEFREAIGGHPLVAETLYRRGYHTLEAARSFMDPDAYQPAPADELPDAQTAYRLLAEAINNHGRILVWGDFDVDGQTATMLLVEGLRKLGGEVIYHIPVRAEESHGITQAILESYLTKGFELLLTCDTGISEHENINTIRNAGIPVIVTDHHSLSDTLPPANAVVNPQRLPDDHPLRTLPGVGVAYKLIEGLFNYLEVAFDPCPSLELAALGIVADVAELQGDTRYILQKGLRCLRHTQRVGLQTLFRNADLNPLHINEDHIGFQIAPRMNAVGRLGDANSMVEFLTTENPGQARVLGTQIEAMNAKRRFATRQVERAAEKMLQDSPGDRHAPAIVLHHPEWPGGVVGIVASRLVEHYHKPAILLTGDDPIHGSARSIEGVNITEAIATQAELLTGYGGHPMAAGLSFPASEYSAFKRGFLSSVEERTKHIEPIPEIEISQIIQVGEISLDLIQEIERLAPFGPGNPPLNFMIRDLQLVSDSVVGQTGEHRQVIASRENGTQQRFIWWNGGDEPLPEAQFDLICQLSQSDYKGTPQISAEWIDFRLSTKGVREIKHRQFELIDHRHTPTPNKILDKLLSNEVNMHIWGEGCSPKDLPAQSRQNLGQGGTLVIWTAPPSQSVLENVIRRTSPKKVILFGMNPDVEKSNSLMERIAGMAKYAIKEKEGQTSLTALASACATETQTIRTALQLWEAMGNLEVRLNGDQVLLSANRSIPNPQSIHILKEILNAQLAESRAYRRYFKTSKLSPITQEHSIQ